MAALLAAAFAWVAPSGAAELPAREQIEAKGWAIGFSPADRPLAEGIVGKLADFEKRMAAIDAAKQELGAAELETRAGELAKKAAAVCALPGSEETFRREFTRAAAAAREVNDALHDAMFFHKIELWRTTEVRERMGAGEQLAGFKWDAKENRPTVNFAFNWSVSSDDFRVTKTIDLPPAIFLRIEKPGDPTAAASAAKDLENWASLTQQMIGRIKLLAVRLSGPVAIGRVFKGALAEDPATTWMREGLTAYVWREVVRQSVSAKAAGNYAVIVAQLPVGKAGDEAINLEAWPKQDVEDYQMMARQVFINIAETDGPAALTELLTTFWKLPVDQRTSANLRRLYREQVKAGIEARAPRRSLGAVAPASSR